MAQSKKRNASDILDEYERLTEAIRAGTIDPKKAKYTGKLLDAWSKTFFIMIKAKAITGDSDPLWFMQDVDLDAIVQ